MFADEERDYELGARYGDPRRCPVHGCTTSSPDGMFDALCPACEAEMDEAAAMEEVEAEHAARELSREYYADMERDAAAELKRLGEEGEDIEF